jgi:hypothetical protein
MPRETHEIPLAPFAKGEQAMAARRHSPPFEKGAARNARGGICGGAGRHAVADRCGQQVAEAMRVRIAPAMQFDPPIRPFIAHRIARRETPLRRAFVLLYCAAAA